MISRAFLSLLKHISEDCHLAKSLCRHKHVYGSFHRSRAGIVGIVYNLDAVFAFDRKPLIGKFKTLKTLCGLLHRNSGLKSRRYGKSRIDCIVSAGNRQVNFCCFLFVFQCELHTVFGAVAYIVHIDLTASRSAYLNKSVLRIAEGAEEIIIAVYYEDIILAEVGCNLHFGFEYVFPAAKVFNMCRTYIGYYPYIRLCNTCKKFYFTGPVHAHFQYADFSVRIKVQNAERKSYMVVEVAFGLGCLELAATYGFNHIAGAGFAYASRNTDNLYIHGSPVV